MLFAMSVVTPVAAQEEPANNAGSTPSTTVSAQQDPCATPRQDDQGANTDIGQDIGQTVSGESMTADDAASVSTDVTSDDSADMNQGASQQADIQTFQFPCPGIDRATAGPPFAEEVQVFPGTSHWYRFRYQANDEDDDEDSNVVITLKMEQANCVAFDVTTSGRLNFPFDDEGDPLGPVGRGTPLNTGDNTDPETLVWVGSSDFTETYFAIVRNRTNSPCTYQLTISGAPVVY